MPELWGTEKRQLAPGTGAGVTYAGSGCGAAASRRTDAPLLRVA